MAETSSSLFDLTYSRRVPLSCTFELNRACNLKCVHCYLADKTRGAELATAEVKRVLRETALAGTLYLAFTGGEILLRRDIFELCGYARALRFDLKLFTNGTLIDESAARRLADIRPSSVDISLYGREKTHDAITKANGSFARTVRAVKLLRKFGVKVNIKVPLMRVNYRDFGWLKAFAKRHGSGLRADAVVTPREDGDAGPLKYRLPYDKIGRFYPAGAGKTGNPDKYDSLLCSAGRNLFAVRAGGEVLPCLQLNAPFGNVKRAPFAAIWSEKNKKVSSFLSIKPSDIAVCSSCELAADCQRCPGIALLEDHDLLGPSKTACKIAQNKPRPVSNLCD